MTLLEIKRTELEKQCYENGSITLHQLEELEIIDSHEHASRAETILERVELLREWYCLHYRAFLEYWGPRVRKKGGINVY